MFVALLFEEPMCQSAMLLHFENPKPCPKLLLSVPFRLVEALPSLHGTLWQDLGFLCHVAYLSAGALQGTNSNSLRASVEVFAAVSSSREIGFIFDRFPVPVSPLALEI